MTTAQFTDHSSWLKCRMMTENLADYYLNRHLHWVRPQVPEDEPTVLVFECDFERGDDSTAVHREMSGSSEAPYDKTADRRSR